MSQSQSPIVNTTARPTIIPVVMPPSLDRSSSGRILNVSVRMVDHSGTLQSDGEGGWAVAPRLAKQQYKLLEDYYTEENNREGWAKYQQYVKDWQGGKTAVSFPGHLLPEQVQKMQRGEVEAKHRDPWAIPPPPPPRPVLMESDPALDLDLAAAVEPRYARPPSLGDDLVDGDMAPEQAQRPEQRAHTKKK